MNSNLFRKICENLDDYTEMELKLFYYEFISEGLNINGYIEDVIGGNDNLISIIEDNGDDEIFYLSGVEDIPYNLFDRFDFDTIKDY